MEYFGYPFSFDAICYCVLVWMVEMETFETIVQIPHSLAVWFLSVSTHQPVVNCKTHLLSVKVPPLCRSEKRNPSSCCFSFLVISATISNQLYIRQSASCLRRYAHTLCTWMVGCATMYWDFFVWYRVKKLIWTEIISDYKMPLKTKMYLYWC